MTNTKNPYKRHVCIPQSSIHTTDPLRTLCRPYKGYPKGHVERGLLNSDWCKVCKMRFDAINFLRWGEMWWEHGVFVI